jgi:hypothetical protein
MNATKSVVFLARALKILRHLWSVMLTVNKPMGGHVCFMSTVGFFFYLQKLYKSLNATKSVVFVIGVLKILRNLWSVMLTVS